MRCDLYLLLKVRWCTVQLTLSFSLTMAFMGMWWWDGVSYTQPACPFYGTSWNFISTPQTFIEHVLCAWQCVQCCDNKARWLGTPFAKTLEVGPVRHVEVWHVWVSVPSLAAFIPCCGDLLPEELDPGCDRWAPVTLMTHSPEPFHQHSGEPAVLGWWDGL